MAYTNLKDALNAFERQVVVQIHSSKADYNAINTKIDDAFIGISDLNNAFADEHNTRVIAEQNLKTELLNEIGKIQGVEKIICTNRNNTPLGVSFDLDDSSTSSTFNINSATDQYNYSFSSISPSSGTVTGNTTISGSATRSEKNYSVYFSASNGYWDRSSTSKPYSSGIYLSGQTVTINGESNTFHCYKSDANYDYVFNYIGGASGTVGKGKTIYGYATAKPKSKTITLGSGNATWDNPNPITVTYGDLIYITGNNSFSINGQTRSYRPSWHYCASGLNVSGDCEYDTTGGYQVYRVKGNVTITPRCYWDDSSNW